MDKLITITEQEYAKLLTNNRTLEALYDYGVDNWGGYGDCFGGDDYAGGMSFDESIDKYVAVKVASARRKYGVDFD